MARNEKHEAGVTIPKKLTSFNMVTVATIVAGLFFTREILVPIALAILLSLCFHHW